MPGKVIFFDLGDTLGAGQVDSSGIVTRFDPFPFVPEILKKLNAAPPAGLGFRLGVISNTPAGNTAGGMKTVLKAAGLLEFFDPTLLLFSSVEGIDKTQKALFQRAASRAGLPAKQCIFVGEDAGERTVAESAHFISSFHPLHLFRVLKAMP